MAEKWIQGAIKRPGALRRTLGTEEGENIPAEKLDKTISGLKKKAKGDKKLTAAQRRLLRQATMAKTIGEM
jgi:hypothetical protein